MDGFDAVSVYFDSKVISFYGLDKAISDGIMPEPYYIYATDGYKTLVNDALSKLGNVPEIVKKQSIVDMRSSVKALNKLTNAPDIIYEGIEHSYTNGMPKYMRFMVFFPTKKVLEHRKDEVKGWFKSKFIEYNVEELVIHSSIEEKRNLDVLPNLEAKPYTINLIMSINMLNEGYHLSDITGVIMLRPTQSSAIYTQQIGRSMQVNIDHNPLIFDFVANLNVHSIFDVDTRARKVSDTQNEEIPLEVQIEELNSISKYNVHIIDKVADVKRVVRKMNQELPSDVEAEVIRLRTDYIPRPASVLSSITGVSIWEVYKILEKYDNLLRPLGLHKQEADMWVNGFIDGKRVE